MTDKIIAYKGFNKDMTCRGFQYGFGKTYKHDGDVSVCNSGFHACENPMDVFRFYSPIKSRFGVVEMSGYIDRSEDNDTKIASGEIFIQRELSLHEMIDAAVKATFDNAKSSKGSAATGDYGAASATGDYGAASATGENGAASATGDCGAASATGYKGKVSGSDGNALFLVERDEYGVIVSVWAGIVGRDGIKPDTFYTLTGSKPVEC